LIGISTLAHILKQAKIPVDQFLKLPQERVLVKTKRGMEVKYG